MICVTVFSQEKKRDALDEFLWYSGLKARRNAFEDLVRHKEDYLPNILKKLKTWRYLHKGRPAQLDRLLYLVAMFRDATFLDTLEEMIRDRVFVDDCIYDCPIVFVCILYACFEGWSPPADLDPKLTVSVDIYGGIRKVSLLTLQKTDPRYYARGPGIDSYLDEALKLSQEELIKRADPGHPIPVERLAAAFVLEYTVAESRNLKDLYWLAINSEATDFEYRMSIYQAIYKAEKAKRAGR